MITRPALPRWPAVIRGFLVVVTGTALAALVIRAFAFRWDWPDLWPSQWWLGARETARLPVGWDYVFSPYSRLLEASVNTVVIAVAATALALVLCWPAARSLARRANGQRAVAETLFAAPLYVPETAMAIALLAIFVRTGAAGSLLAIILAHVIPIVPYMLRTLTAMFERHAMACEEQARLLGARPAQILVLVTLPMVAPGVAAACLFAFLVSNSVFLLTFFLGQGRVVTLPTILFSKLSSGTLDASTAGLALLAAAPGIVALVAFGRFLDPAPPTHPRAGQD